MTFESTRSARGVHRLSVGRLREQLHPRQVPVRVPRPPHVEEAIGGQSRADFVSKLGIAYKEARKTSYWLRLLKDTDYLTEAEFQSIHADAEELCRIIGAIQKSTKANANAKP